jgi:hypothetical protein
VVRYTRDVDPNCNSLEAHWAEITFTKPPRWPPLFNTDDLLGCGVRSFTRSSVFTRGVARPRVGDSPACCVESLREVSIGRGHRSISYEGRQSFSRPPLRHLTPPPRSPHPLHHTTTTARSAATPSTAAATARAPSASRSTTATRAPASANARQHALPIPLAPPVTTATRRSDPSRHPCRLAAAREDGARAGVRTARRRGRHYPMEGVLRMRWLQPPPARRRCRPRRAAVGCRSRR